jgi:uncharacterized membrane protein YwaF
MGPWPVYIVVADVLAAALFWLLYWPYHAAETVAPEVAPPGGGG